MKTAIIYSGGMRSFDACMANHRWMLWRHFPEAKFFICTEDDEDAHKADLISGAVVKKVKQPEMVAPPGCPTQWYGPGKPYMHEPYAISVPPQAVLGQLWMLRQAWGLYEESGYKAELVVRIRPDLWFHSFELPKIIRAYLNPRPGQYVDFGMTTAYVPWWGRFGGFNDRLALLGRDVAAHYFMAYAKITRLIANGAPLHPESLVAASLRDGGAFVDDTLKAEFSTLRKSGEMRPPEITLVDIAHASMR
jgi:hypothetical protein